MRALALLLWITPAFAQDEVAKPPPEFERIAREGTVPERLDLAVWLLRESERRVLAPTAAQRESVSELLRRADTGITCLADGDSLKLRTLTDSSGSWFSFEHESHGQGYMELDLRLGNGFNADFYGGRIGMVLPIGDVDLLSLPISREPIPAALEGNAQNDWLTLWEHITEEDVARDSLFRENVKPMLQNFPVEEDATYLVRLCHPEGANRLTAFRVLGHNDHGAVTIAWRVLHRWKRTTLVEPERPERWDEVALAPEWLWATYDQVDQASIEAWLTELRERSQVALFDITPDRIALYEEVIASQVESFGARSGFGRILRRFAYGPLVGQEGDGAYYSFKQAKVTWSEGQLGLSENGSLWGPFAGNLVLDLGELPFDQIRAAIGGKAPTDFEADGVLMKSWELLWSPIRLPGRKVSPEVEAQLVELGLRANRSPRATLGHSFLYRNTQGNTDELVLLTVIEADEVGISFAWRIVKSFATR